MEIPAIPYKNGSYKVWIDNLSGKVDLNAADGSTLRLVLGGLDLPDTQRDIIADSILDWRDKDDLHRTNGAENDYYESLPKPYACKNADFDSVSELLLVRGVTPALYNGALKWLFTVYPENGNASKAAATWLQRKVLLARRKINLNAASRQTLLHLPGMTEEAVEQIVDYRKEKDFTTLSQLVPMMGSRNFAQCAGCLNLILSQVYIFHSLGRVTGSRSAHYLKAMVVFNPLDRHRYRIVRWWDSGSA
jgi:general secretion pathway protein K